MLSKLNGSCTLHNVFYSNKIAVCEPKNKKPVGIIYFGQSRKNFYLTPFKESFNKLSSRERETIIKLTNSTSLKKLKKYLYDFLFGTTKSDIYNKLSNGTCPNTIMEIKNIIISHKIIMYMNKNTFLFGTRKSATDYSQLALQANKGNAIKSSALSKKFVLPLLTDKNIVVCFVEGGGVLIIDSKYLHKYRCNKKDKSDYEYLSEKTNPIFALQGLLAKLAFNVYDKFVYDCDTRSLVVRGLLLGDNSNSFLLFLKLMLYLSNKAIPKVRNPKYNPFLVANYPDNNNTILNSKTKNYINSKGKHKHLFYCNTCNALNITEAIGHYSRGRKCNICNSMCITAETTPTKQQGFSLTLLFDCFVEEFFSCVENTYFKDPENLHKDHFNKSLDLLANSLTGLQQLTYPLVTNRNNNSLFENYDKLLPEPGIFNFIGGLWQNEKDIIYTNLENIMGEVFL